MTLEKVKQIINSSQFPSDLKQRLGLILPNLEKNTLTGLGREVSRRDSLFVASDLVKLWENFAGLIGRFKRGDSSAVRDFFKIFQETENSILGEDRLYFLNLVLDVRVLANGGRVSFSSEQFERILDYEISMFWHLPKEEIMFLLENQLLFLLSKVDLLKHIEVVIWEKDWDYEKDFSKTFSNLLFENQEKLGAKAVGAWIKEYFNFSSPSLRTDVVHVAEFLVKNPSVQQLTNAERKTLSDILKLYVWLLEPEINEDEVINYKEQVREKEAEKITQELLKLSSQSPEKKVTDIFAQKPPMAKVFASPVLPPLAVQQKFQPSPGLSFRPQKPPRFQAAPQPNRTPDISQIRREIEERKQQAQRQIDRKLEDLKNRKTPIK